MYLNLYHRVPRSQRVLPSSVFDSLFSDLLANPTDSSRVARSARLDVIDRNDRFEAILEIPGVKKEDIEVKIEAASVTVKAESKTEHEVKDGERVIHSEREVRRFERTFELPVEIAEDKAEARYEDGVLQLILPKKDAVQARRLQVN